MTDILDTIDNAIADCELSADAMRWTPDPQPATGGHLLASPDIARLFDVPPGFITFAAWAHAERDRTAQAADDPSLGHTISEQAIRSALGTDPSVGLEPWQAESLALFIRDIPVGFSVEVAPVTTPDDPMAWLRAQIAKAAGRPHEVHDLTCELTMTAGFSGPCTCGWADRILAEVAAKRRLLDWLDEAERFMDHDDMSWHRLSGAVDVDHARRLLLLPFADREGYREEWRP